MPTLLTTRQRITNTTYARHFTWRDTPGAGFSFDCDEQGNILSAGFAPEALDNLAKCLDGTFDVTDDGVVTYTNTYIEPATIRCSCGEIVALEHFTNTCHRCERDYNLGGQLLAPRDQWGEETGETYLDIIGL